MQVGESRRADATAGQLGWGRRYLMVEPRHFTVSYHINPWMTPGVRTDVAVAQWAKLVATMQALGADVVRAADVEGLPDMAFAMNGAFVVGEMAVPSRFRHEQRQAEEPYWHKIFADLGLTVTELDAGADVRFEAGDAFLLGDVLVGAWGFRSEKAAGSALARQIGARHFLGLHLVDERFYHLDTCFCPLSEDLVVYFPAAFEPASAAELAATFPEALRLTEPEALTFCANSLLIGQTVVSSGLPPRVSSWLAERGYDTATVGLGEFHKSGGSARCLTLPLDVQAPRRT